MIREKSFFGCEENKKTRVDSNKTYVTRLFDVILIERYYLTDRYAALFPAFTQIPSAAYTPSHSYRRVYCIVNVGDIRRDPWDLTTIGRKLRRVKCKVRAYHQVKLWI